MFPVETVSQDDCDWKRSARAFPARLPAGGLRRRSALAHTRFALF
jgi:hypothetical protein